MTPATSNDSDIPPVPAPDTPQAEDPVGAPEIASRLGLAARSVNAMRRRGSLPTPDYKSINGKPAWHWRTVLWWAGQTNRLKSRRLLNEYRAAFRREPPSVG